MNYTFTKAGKNWNEDRCYSCEDFAFVLDGATGVSDQKISDKNSDAEWYSNYWCEYLKEALKDKTKPIYEILEDGMDKVVTEFQNLAKGKVIFDFPSCSASIARKVGDEIELYAICDSPILIQAITGKTLEVGDTLNNINDGVNLLTLDYYAKKDEISIFEAHNKYHEVVVKGRKTKNKPFGYNVLSNSKEVIRKGVYKKIDAKIFKKVLLMTDGYSQVYDLFNLYSADEFASKLNCVEDAQRIYDELYQAQETDNLGRNYIRFKLRDDASLAVLDFTDNG